jgi:hypothetical protein
MGGASPWKMIAGAVCSAAALYAQSTILYQTTFEPQDGYDINKDLNGQKGWIGDGTGGNGLINGLFQGFGQQAYVGFLAPTKNESFTSTWYPVLFDPSPVDNPLVRFSVTFQIVQSTTGTDDDFQWSIHNLPGERLFSLNFESATGNISYFLQDGKQLQTDSHINFDGFYDLDIWMDFRRNQWTAFLNDFLLINSETIAQGNSPLNFGDADAVWALRGSTSSAGNNYMAFDNYRVTSELLPAIPGFVQVKGVTNGVFHLTAYGEKGVKYAIDATTDFSQWLNLGEFENPQGGFEFKDDTSTGFKHGFYRMRPVP